MAEDRRHSGGQFQETDVEHSAPIDPTLTSEQPCVGHETAIGLNPVHRGDIRAQPATAPSAADALRSQISVSAAPLVEVAVRLYAEFSDRVTVNELLATLDRCRNDLDTMSAAALPEMVERLVRQRLAARTSPPAARNGAMTDET